VIETVFSWPTGSRSVEALSSWRSGNNKPRFRRDHNEGGGGGWQPYRRGGAATTNLGLGGIITKEEEEEAGGSSIIAVVTEDNGEAWAETSNSAVDLAASFRID
jgi:hypothetical protein